MTKENLIKIICSGNVLQSQDLSADEKKLVFSLMEKYGLPQSTCYRRFFEKGFSKWEISGINCMKLQFVRKHQAELDEVEYPKKSKTYNGSLLFPESLEPGVFYEQLKNEKLVNQFKAFMLENGMCAVTSYKRFVSDDDWQEWEKIGVEKILIDNLDL